MAEEHPDITDCKNLNKYADLFKTSESGDLGQFLGSDPSYVQYDEALITNLDLNFKVIFTGGEAATITAFQQAVDATRSRCSATSGIRSGCTRQIDARPGQPAAVHGRLRRRPGEGRLRLPGVRRSTRSSARSSRPKAAKAYELVKNFTWTNEDQNLVSDYITNQDMTPEEAAAKWVADNEAKWKAWMPQ